MYPDDLTESQCQSCGQVGLTEQPESYKWYRVNAAPVNGDGAKLFISLERRVSTSTKKDEYWVYLNVTKENDITKSIEINWNVTIQQRQNKILENIENYCRFSKSITCDGCVIGSTPVIDPDCPLSIEIDIASYEFDLFH